MSSSEVERIVKELRDRGCSIGVDADGQLVVKGKLTPDLVERIRANKPMITSSLRTSGAAAKVSSETWQAMRRLAPFLGSPVKLNNFWESGILWGLTPHGAAVDVGPVLVNFPHTEVEDIL